MTVNKAEGGRYQRMFWKASSMKRYAGNERPGKCEAETIEKLGNENHHLPPNLQAEQLPYSNQISIVLLHSKLQKR